ALKAIVGSQADHELLNTIAPSNLAGELVHNQRRRAQPSESLLAALSETSTGKALDHVKRVFLPKVSIRQYSRYFKTLLWRRSTAWRIVFLSKSMGLSRAIGMKAMSILFDRRPLDCDSTASSCTSILLQQPGSAPFAVFGPPGTGKTITIVEAMKQLLKHKPNSRILATAPSNSAADIIASRLASTLGPDELSDFTHPPGTSTNVGIPRGHFTHIFVDEAGQATEPEVMIGIKTMADNATNIVLAGDPKQLGPIIRSKLQGSLGWRKAISNLVKNFRSHPAILKFPNERFYANDLESCGNKNIIRAFEGWNKLPSKKFPIIFHSISGKDDREATSPSFFNIDEVTQVRKYIQLLRDDRQIRVAHNEIGVIAPYHAQCVKIRKMLSGVADEVKVGSVEEFQGQERRVIIISTVRSSRDFVEFDLKYTLGFVANPRRFNVAVTRAKALLIVIGDPNVLSLDPLWRSFLNYVHLNGGWAGPGPTWDTTETVDESGEYDQHIRAAAMTDMSLLARRIEEVVTENVQTGTASGDDDDECKR
ncbi:P-loop containing nucleoside triphosphate hydrolase protein, partial [Suillus occidentalis]